MFTDRHAYGKFSNGLKNANRFGLDAESRQFIDTFRAGASDLEITFEAKGVLYRAVDDYREEIDEIRRDFHFTGASEKRLKPTKEFAKDGRASPRGIPILYLATSRVTAVSEIRPWIGQYISVAEFSLVRDLRIADLSRCHNQTSLDVLTFEELAGRKQISEEKANRCVWTDINNAFSEPMTRADAQMDYLPTQMLSEALKVEGFDGLAYKSSFGGDEGYNVALFDLDAARARTCGVYSINNITFDFEEKDSPWSKSFTDE